ncbi:MAG: TolC family protein [Planctomycetaceae bacterium]|nr:TolC family protein [Planctomycetaceae bacterium]
MRRSLVVGLAVWVVAVAGRAQAQGPGTTPELPEIGGSTSIMGNAPGSGGGSFSNLPGTGGFLGGRAGVSAPRSVPTSVVNPASAPSPTALQMAISAPPPAPISPSAAPLVGPLELPSGPEDDGPPDGLTLDQAIDITLERSRDLRAKYYEIPQAKADILQASLRANPVFYQDGQLVPYPGYRFSRTVPGGPTQYDTNFTFLIDVARQRQARTAVAVRAEKVLEAQYQEAIRQRIDDIYDAYVLGALSARQTVRYSRVSVQGLENLFARYRDLYKQGNASLGDLNRIKIQLRTAQLGLADALAAYRNAKFDLGSLMNLTREEVDKLELRGTIYDRQPPPPPVEELRRIALESRPDIISYRLGVQRAEADVRLARANRYANPYLLFQPYTYQDNTPYGVKSALSYALGITVPLPIYNRNQGGIQRAVLNVTQTQIELSDTERQALVDVEKAVQEYEISRREVNELARDVIPAAKQVRDEAYRLLVAGERSLVEYIAAQQDFNQVAKQYLDTAIRHRRSMVNLNTVTGKRILQ